ncbi:hypothetical protein [Ohtaekwangia koreensis]|uniref:Uncharacterized protein n=1 Tax=Ohtaekwangia koreensis TaxID=688867 RepID=A0A1T5J8A2_9BACT|nr:hypothetical protein [Ohtaekwangia koreensis]SKC47473.1 hypothetical protein SAMN05660236_0853 [Ohtaekwangia koreensis]
MDIEELVKKHSTSRNELDSLFQSYLRLTFNPGDFSEDEGIKIIYGTNNLLMSLARPFFEYNKFKDTWDNSKFYMNAYGQTLILESKKTNHTFEFGIDREVIYLQSYISYPENFKNMNDGFWRSVLELSNYGDFSFVENAVMGSKETQYFNNKKSNLFRLLRNYFLHEINNLDLESHQRNYDMNLGWFHIKWKFGTPWTEIMKNGSLAFKILYQLHYELWKVSDLRSKKHRRSDTQSTNK